MWFLHTLCAPNIHWSILLYKPWWMGSTCHSPIDSCTNGVGIVIQAALFVCGWEYRQGLKKDIRGGPLVGGYNRGSHSLEFDHGVGYEGVINSFASSRLYLYVNLECIWVPHSGTMLKGKLNGRLGWGGACHLGALFNGGVILETSTLLEWDYS